MGSSAAATDCDEPLTPAGRLFFQPQMNQIVHCAIGFRNPIDIDSIKLQVKSSLMFEHPRFSSLMVRDSSGRERWHKSPITDLDRHVIVVRDPVSSSGAVDHDSAVNDYLADLAVGTELPADKPLWEFHLLMAHNVAVFRVHHALGDGVSLMSMFLAICRRADDGEKLPSLPSGKSSSGARQKVLWVLLVGFLKMMLFSLVFVLEFVMRCLWVCDRKTVISGGDGVELWPRKLATAKFSIQDMKLVKKAVPNATINDVLFGVISSGISRYLDHRSPKALPEGLRITGVAMANLREQPGLQELSDMIKSNSGTSWGNKFGMLLLPIYYHNSKSNADPLAYMKRSKVMIDKKKQSLEGHFSYNIGYFVMTYLGPKIASWLNYRVVCNTSFTISNILGPQEEITFGGNPVTFLRVNSSSLPHALTMHMISYAERADMQILVAKDIIPDPAFLAKCFEEALFDMKEAAAATSRT